MNKTVFLILRIILGAALIFFGVNKFYPIMTPPEEPSEAMGIYFTALMSTKTLTVVAIIEILAGLSLLLNKFAPLMMVILMSVSVCAVLFHITLDPGGTGPAAVLLILNIVMLYGYKDRYTGILKP